MEDVSPPILRQRQERDVGQTCSGCPQSGFQALGPVTVAEPETAKSEDAGAD